MGMWSRATLPKKESPHAASLANKSMVTAPGACCVAARSARDCGIVVGTGRFKSFYRDWHDNKGLPVRSTFGVPGCLKG